MEEIEQLAERLLEEVPDYVWDGRRLPVPVEDIVDSCFGLLVREEENLALAPGAPAVPDGRTLSGLLLVARHEIWVNAAEAREWPGRRRFTICHELGHWLLHRERGGAVHCRAGGVDEGDGARGDELPVEETQANAFAAALLLPRELLRGYYGRLQPHGEFDFQRACDLFAVSGAAMGRRLHAVC